MLLSKQKIFSRLRYLFPLLLFGWFFPVFSGTIVHASSITPERVIALVNESRAEAGLPALTLNTTLTEAAEAKGKDMLKENYFAHTSPAGKSPWYWIKRSGYRYRSAGENLAVNYFSAEAEHTAWMKSEKHRANILSDRFEEIGVATVLGKLNGENTMVVVQVFGTPMTAVAKKSSVVSEKTGSQVQPNPSQPELSQHSVLSAASPSLNTLLSPSVPPEPVPTMPLIDPKITLVDRLILFTLGLLSVVFTLTPGVFLFRGWRTLLLMCWPPGITRWRLIVRGEAQ